MCLVGGLMVRCSSGRIADGIEMVKSKCVLELGETDQHSIIGLEPAVLPGNRERRQTKG